MNMNIVKIQRFSTHDGPGIRTVVFAKGCPLRCKWCHNPETQSPLPQIFYNSKDCIFCGNCAIECQFNAHRFSSMNSHVFDPICCHGCQKCAEGCPTGAIEKTGQDIDTSKIIDTILRDKAFYDRNGGMTLSGGEPMMQPEASLELLKMAKREGISTAVETCGYFDPLYVKELSENTDWLLWDVKDCVNERHRKYTGVSNESIISNLFSADAAANHIILRCIIVEGINTDLTHIKEVSKIYHSLSHCDGIELIPYHSFGGSKRVQLGYENNGNSSWIPSQNTMSNIRMELMSSNCKLL